MSRRLFKAIIPISDLYVTGLLTTKSQRKVEKFLQRKVQVRSILIVRRPVEMFDMAKGIPCASTSLLLYQDCWMRLTRGQTSYSCLYSSFSFPNGWTISLYLFSCLSQQPPLIILPASFIWSPRKLIKELCELSKHLSTSGIKHSRGFGYGIKAPGELIDEDQLPGRMQLIDNTKEPCGPFCSRSSAHSRKIILMGIRKQRMNNRNKRGFVKELIVWLSYML